MAGVLEDGASREQGSGCHDKGMNSASTVGTGSASWRRLRDLWSRLKRAVVGDHDRQGMPRCQRRSPTDEMQAELGMDLEKPVKLLASAAAMEASVDGH